MKLSLKNFSLITIKSSIFNNRWAIVAILIGTIVGFTSVYLCTRLNLIIFGFNMAYVVSPLIAGFTETIVAKRKHGNSTGAISAIFVFIVINVWGYAFPQDPIALNFFTLAGIGLAIQAAFPILINYIIFVVFVGSLTYILGYLGNLIAIALEKLGRKQEKEVIEKDFIPMKTIATSTSSFDGKNVEEYLGLVYGEALVAGKDKKTRNDYSPEKELEKAVNKAMLRMDMESEVLGADAIIEVQIEYVNVGGITGSMLMVNAIGNAVRYK